MEHFHIMSIDLSLREENIFPFDIYLFNPENKKYTLFLAANKPFDKNYKKVYSVLISSGKKLAIKDGQQQTFNRALNLNISPEEIVQLSNENLGTTSNEPQGKESEFQYNLETVHAFETDDFTKIIEYVRGEITSLPLSLSPTLSLGIELAQKVFHEDNKVNRVAALSFMLARFAGIDDPKALGDLFVASLIHQTGITQINLELSRKPRQEFSSKQVKSFKRVEGLTQHLVRKTGLKVSNRCMKIILESQERSDGSGYPNMKRLEHIEPLALILGCINHIFEFINGTISGKKTSIWTTIKCLENKTPIPGLQFTFGDQVLGNAVYLIKKRNDVTEKKAA